MSRDLEALKADTSWFHIFKELIRSGTWAKMSPNSKAVYPVVKNFVNWETGVAFPSITTIMQYAGLSRQAVVNGLKDLEALGLIRKEHQERGRGSYRLIERFEVMEPDGSANSVVTFDYLPSMIKEAVAQLKNFAAGVAVDGNVQIISVEHLNLTVGNVNIANNQQINEGEATGVMVTEEGSGLQQRPK